MSNTFLDLDEVKAPEITLKVHGKTHVMSPMTVEGFIDNLKLAQEATGGIANDTEIAKKVIRRAFPTLEDKDLLGMELPQLHRLVEFISEVNGQKKAEQATDGVPQPAA